MGESIAQTLLSAVEGLEPTACGAFIIECHGRNVGTIFVERNQVCWAAATGQGRRLRDLLREHLATTVTNDELERTYQACKDEGRRLGESLVARSLVTSDAMRAALKQHTIESLISLPEQRGERIEWIAHRQQGYAPRFTFTPLELLVATNAHLYRAESEGAELGLSLLELDTPGASFVTSDDGEPIAVRISGRHANIRAVQELGLWAHAAFGVCRGFSAAVIERVITGSRGELSLAWRTSKRVLNAAVIDDADRVRRIVASLERRSIPTLLSKRADNPLELPVEMVSARLT